MIIYSPCLGQARSGDGNKSLQYKELELNSRE